MDDEGVNKARKVRVTLAMRSGDGEMSQVRSGEKGMSQVWGLPNEPGEWAQGKQQGERHSLTTQEEEEEEGWGH